MTIDAGSRRVLGKVGMRTYHQEFEDPVAGTENGGVEYALTREEWLATGPGPSAAMPR